LTLKGEFKRLYGRGCVLGVVAATKGFDKDVFAKSGVFILEHEVERSINNKY